MDDALERVGADEFEGTGLRRPGVVAVAFLADWCPFCRAFLPKFASLSRIAGLRLLVGDVTDDSSPLWNRFGLDVVPTVLVYRAGQPVLRVDGVPGVGIEREALATIARAAREALGGAAPSRRTGRR